MEVKNNIIQIEYKSLNKKLNEVYYYHFRNRKHDFTKSSTFGKIITFGKVTKNRNPKFLPIKLFKFDKLLIKLGKKCQ